jgi:anti-sigma regulatory factor (Ser/Thr protein kinase)
VALFYEGEEEYLDGIMRFIGPAIAAGEPVAAALPPGRARLLRQRLNHSADRIEMLDGCELGSNPSRIIPEVEGILDSCDGGRLHYVSEPIWAGRSREEVQEATRHEALVNLAWPGAPISILCPYDAAALTPEVLADAERTHPHVIHGGERARSDAYGGPTIPQRCDGSLPAPPADARSMVFTMENLSKARSLVAEVAGVAGLSRERIEDLLIVASELGSNAIRHGNGVGTLHVWARGDRVTCQVQDRGQIADPLAGRRRPKPGAIGGLGLWVVNQLCNLVEARTGEHGTTVRAHLALG